jgi:hypothetical protein
MKSMDIERIAPTDMSTNSWLKLMALQLSILIESIAAPVMPPEPPIEKRGPGRPRKVQ